MFENNKLSILPEELQNAPDDVKKSYFDVLEMDELSENHEQRYFDYVDTKTLEPKTVSCRGVESQILIHVKRNNIDPNLIPELKKYIDACRVIKQQKINAGAVWRRWARPRIGKNIFEWKKAEILELCGRMASNDDIKKKIESWGYEIRIDHIASWRRKNADIIDKKRLEFLTSSHDYYIATETGRIETCAMIHSDQLRIYTELNQKIETPSIREEKRAITKTLLSLIEYVRKELKGDEIKLNINGSIDINATLAAAKAIKEVSKQMPINMIVIYLVAAKQGIKPDNIITSLANSYYKNFNGFSKIDELNKPNQAAELIKGYNWEDIMRTNRDLELNPIKQPLIEDYEVISDPQKVVVMDKRDLLKQALFDLNNNSLK